MDKFGLKQQQHRVAAPTIYQRFTKWWNRKFTYRDPATGLREYKGDSIPITPLSYLFENGAGSGRLRDGKGVLTLTSGEWILGEWDRDYPDGIMLWGYPDGSAYQGELVIKGKKFEKEEGKKGLLKLRDYTGVIEGMWDGYKPNAEMIWKDNYGVYKGTVVMKQEVIKGNTTFRDYEREKGVLTGKGTLPNVTSEDFSKLEGTINYKEKHPWYMATQYVGGFSVNKNGIYKPQGQGKMTYLDGSTLEGIWEDGELKKGLIYINDKIKIKFEIGKDTWTDYNSYTFVGNLLLKGYRPFLYNNEEFLQYSKFDLGRYGEGTIRYNNGDVYVGKVDVMIVKYYDGKVVQQFNYEDQKQSELVPNGNGKMEYKNGDQFEGILKDGKPNGKGVMKKANGDKFEGEWKDGIQVLVQNAQFENPTSSIRETPPESELGNPLLLPPPPPPPQTLQFDNPLLSPPSLSAPPAQVVVPSAPPAPPSPIFAMVAPSPSPISVQPSAPPEPTSPIFAMVAPSPQQISVQPSAPPAPPSPIFTMVAPSPVQQQTSVVQQQTSVVQPPFDPLSLPPPPTTRLGPSRRGRRNSALPG